MPHCRGTTAWHERTSAPESFGVRWPSHSDYLHRCFSTSDSPEIGIRVRSSKLSRQEVRRQSLAQSNPPDLEAWGPRLTLSGQSGCLRIGQLFPRGNGSCSSIPGILNLRKTNFPRKVDETVRVCAYNSVIKLRAGKAALHEGVEAREFLCIDAFKPKR